MIDTGCDECGAPASFIAYAAHDVITDAATNSTHPHVARYPLPMIRACAQHIGPQMDADAEAPISTKQWVVSRCE